MKNGWFSRKKAFKRPIWNNFLISEDKSIVQHCTLNTGHCFWELVEQTQWCARHLPFNINCYRYVLFHVCFLENSYWIHDHRIWEIITVIVRIMIEYLWVAYGGQLLGMLSNISVFLFSTCFYSIFSKCLQQLQMLYFKLSCTIYACLTDLK